MQKETPNANEASSKKQYVAPKLRTLGSVKDITLATLFGTVADGGGGAMSMMMMA